MKFRSKPVEIEAEQFVHPATVPCGVHASENGEYWVVTIHGQKTSVALGDWIIQEPDGEHYYPCKPDIFEKRYEVV